MTQILAWFCPALALRLFLRKEGSMPSNETRANEAHHSSPHHDTAQGVIQVCGLDLNLRPVQLADTTPVGSQVAIAAGFTPNQQVSVIQWRSKSLEDIGPNEPIDLSNAGNRFIVVESDGYSRFTVDGQRFDWPARSIAVGVIRQLAEIAPAKRIYMERQDEPDKLLDDGSVLNLETEGVERLISRIPTWKLNVQGVILTLSVETITVREALVKANINPDQGWHIYLKVAGQPKQELTLTSVIDLTHPGIEKLRLTPKDVSNGDQGVAVRRAFKLLAVDEKFLDTHFLEWETMNEGGRQWLLLHGYPLPDGFSIQQVDLALEVPPTYPAAQIDMFYLYPAITLSTGAQIGATEAHQEIQGKVFQRWSRHRGAGNQWNMAYDNVITHLALVESALLKEVQP
jgi:hypothetical protein